jgi:osmotically-inducible protein OsmY
MNTFKSSMLSLLTILASTSLVADYYQDHPGSQNWSDSTDSYRDQNFSGYSNNSNSSGLNQGQYNTQFDHQQYNSPMNAGGQTSNQGSWSTRGTNQGTWTSQGDVAAQIKMRLQNDPSLSADARNIQVTFDEGTAILKGTVNNDAEKKRIENIVQQVDGVKSVTNKLDVSTQTNSKWW